MSEPTMPISENKMSLIGSLSFWIQKNPVLGFVVWVLAIFCVPVGVLFRRQMGQRWLSIINFYMGLLVVFVFSGAQQAASNMKIAFGGYRKSPFGGFTLQEDTRPQPETSSLSDSLVANSMFFILVIYILLGIYHLFIIWWQEKTNKPVYSYDNGISHFEILAEGFMDLLNIVTKPILVLLSLTLPAAERAKFGNRMPLLLSDVHRFTDTFFEPLMIAIIGFGFVAMGANSTGMFFFLSSMSVSMITQLRYEVTDNKLMDRRDSSILSGSVERYSDYIEKGEAGVIEQLKEIAKDEDLQRKATKSKIIEDIPVAPPPQKKVDSLDFMDIIEEMNTPPKSGG